MQRLALCLLFAALLTRAAERTSVAASTQAGRAAPAIPALASYRFSCTERLKAVFAPKSNVKVILVKAFAQGSDINLNGSPSDARAGDDLCLVKLIVGPGNPGPVHAPSTSKGIGVQIWLPSPERWNKRIQMLGGGGFSGNPRVTSLIQIDSDAIMSQLAAQEGFVFISSDGGHATFIKPEWDSAYPEVNGSFAMLPDGHINTALWKDFSHRATHEAIVKTKAVVEAYYGEAARYSYFTGCSGGGREGHAASQSYPDDFDGILIGNAAIHWAKFASYELYPQIAMLRDLGAPLSHAQLDLVSAAAVSACDTTLNGEHDGFISDLDQCRYDPTRDNQVLCKSEGGSNDTDVCVTHRQAQVCNCPGLIWLVLPIFSATDDVMRGSGAMRVRSGCQAHFVGAMGSVSRRVKAS